MFLRVSHLAGRSLLNLSRRNVLSSAFSLEKEWSTRHSELTKLGLGGDYEWISAVQKKFIGGGMASAVDVDAAVCVAEHRDQVDDVVELIYKLRHSENAADLPLSAEYALVRLLLKHEPEILFKIAQDTINYGIFLNEHSGCLAIDHFIKRDNIQGAARLSAWIMQQEMTDNQLLNLLGIYSCTKWAELPSEEQTMPKEDVEEEDINEDDMKTFKFPYLKNPHFDAHFDLEEAAHLAGKTLMWLGRDCSGLDESMKNSVRFLGAVLYNCLDIAESLASPSIDGAIADIVRARFAVKEGVEPVAQHEKIVAKLESCCAATSPFSQQIINIIEKVRESEENLLCEAQVKEFAEWNKRRHDLVRAQAERVLLKVRTEEITKELAELQHHREKLFFFENRLKWEKKATENNEITTEASQQNKIVANA